tara:strand:+ start:410 stop:1570 length:1161 start_codon:yes stop_codon:yes gene_type:complete
MMMNEFGTPMNDAEMGMLPPGANKPHERLLSESGLEMKWEFAVGAALSIGSAILGKKSADKAASQQNQYVENAHVLNTKQFKYDIQKSFDQWAFAKESVDIQKYNDQLNRDFQNQVRIDEWVDRDRMRIFDYNNQVEAYNMSIERFEKQIDYNSIAEQIALNDTTRVYNEQLISLGFQNEEMQTKLNFETRGMLAQIQGRKAELSVKAQNEVIAGLKAAGTVAASGQVGRSARKNRQEMIAQTGRNQAAIVDAITRDNSAYAFNLEQAYSGFSFGQRQLQQSLKSANAQFEADQQQISVKRWEADMAAHDRIADTPTLAPQLTKPRTLPTPEYQYPINPEDRWQDILNLAPVKGAKADTSFAPIAAGLQAGTQMYGLTKAAGMYEG